MFTENAALVNINESFKYCTTIIMWVLFITEPCIVCSINRPDDDSGFLIDRGPGRQILVLFVFCRNFLRIYLHLTLLSIWFDVKLKSVDRMKSCSTTTYNAAPSSPTETGNALLWSFKKQYPLSWKGPMQCLTLLCMPTYSYKSVHVHLTKKVNIDIWD